MRARILLLLLRIARARGCARLGKTYRGAEFLTEGSETISKAYRRMIGRRLLLLSESTTPDDRLQTNVLSSVEKLAREASLGTSPGNNKTSNAFAASSNVRVCARQVIGGGPGHRGSELSLS